MRTYIYKVADIHNINSKVYYFKRKYVAQLFVDRRAKERRVDMDRISIRQGVELLESQYADYKIVETIRTED